MHIRLFSICTLLVLMFAVPLLSQETIIMEYETTDTLTVVAERDRLFPQYSSIATRAFTTLQNTPAAVAVVSEQLNTNQGNTGLGGALNNFSGVNIQTGFGIHDYFTIRGFNSLDNGLVLTDGTPEPEVIMYNLYNVERVELLKGPGAFLYGTNPLSGTINLVRKQPRFDNFVNVSGNYGSFNSIRGTIDAGFTTAEKSIAGRVNGLFQQSDFYRDDKDNRVYAINPSLTWKLGNSSEITANLEVLNSEYKPDSGIPLVYNPQTGTLDKLADIPRTTSFQTPDDRSEQTMLRIKVNYIKIFESGATLTNRFFMTNLDWQSTGTLITGAYPAMDGALWVNRSLQMLDDTQRFLGNQTEYLMQFGANNIKNSLLVGFEIDRLTDTFEIDVVPQLPPIQLFQPTESYQSSRSPAYPYQAGDVESTVLAPYVMDVVTLFETTHLFLGGRFDHFTVKDSEANATNTHQTFSPFAGASYSLIQDHSVYASAGQAFAAPSTRSDITMDPEKSTQVEAGVKSRWLDGKIESDISIYRLSKSNMAIYDKNGFIVQSGDQRSQGIEVDVRARMTANCASIFSYAYTNAEMTKFNEQVTVGMDENGSPITMLVDRSGNSAAFVPNHIVNFWHNRNLTRNLGIGLGIRYLGRQYIAIDNDYSMDGYTTIDAAISYNVSNMRFSLNFKNISNTEYEMRGFGGYSVIPALPFSVYGGMELAL